MIDAAGETSNDLSMKLGRGSNGSEISVTADKNGWMQKSGSIIRYGLIRPPQFRQNEFIFAMASQGQPNAIYLTGDGNAYVGYADSI